MKIGSLRVGGFWGLSGRTQWKRLKKIGLSRSYPDKNSAFKVGTESAIYHFGSSGGIVWLNCGLFGTGAGSTAHDDWRSGCTSGASGARGCTEW